MRLKVTLIFLVLTFILSSFCFAADDYYTEKSYSSGSTISIAGESYKIIVGNQGQRIRFEGPQVFELKLDECKLRNNTDICFTNNESETKSEITMYKRHGILDASMSRSSNLENTVLLEGEIVEINMSLENTGNLTVVPDYLHKLDGYFEILETDNCYIKDGNIIFNKSIEPDDDAEFSYKFTALTDFKKKEFTPVFYYYNGVKNEEIELNRQNYEVDDTFELEIYIDKSGVELGKGFNFTIFLNNTQEINSLNYSFIITIPKDYEIISDYKLFKYKDDFHKQSKGVLKNLTALTRTLELKPNVINPENISVEIEIKDQLDKTNYVVTKEYNTDVLFTRKPDIILKMNEFVIDEAETLEVILNNNADFPLTNITINASSEFLNKTYTYDSVETAEEIASIELPQNVTGKKIIEVRVSYQTPYGDKFTQTIGKKLTFPNKETSDKIELEDNVFENNTAEKIAEEIKNRIENLSTNETDVEEKTIAENFSPKYIILATAPLLLMILFLIYNKIFKLNKIKKKEEEIESEILKLENELKKKGDDNV